MSQPIISIENLSKSYFIYSKPADLLWEVLSGRPRHDLFWALKNISLSINEGQRVGIIGPNGAGKSTLLKIISGNLSPTSGNVKINGKISAMLTLASSLNPEETGLSNIKFNLLLQGALQADINRLTEEIIDFTELGDFIYRPVKTYSAGMNARLAFAIATSVEPEILIVDEVLGAGDGYFIGKATKRMLDLCNNGKALLFVSHSTSAVQMLCDHVIWMENGSIRMIGSSEHVLKLYEEDYRRREDETTRENNMEKAHAKSMDGTLDQFSSSDIYRLRIVPKNDKRSFHDTHYVRKIRFASGNSDLGEVSLELQDSIGEDTITLDLLSSEWGRIYTKNGSISRTLGKRTGKEVGGQIILRFSESTNKIIDIQLEFESLSTSGKELLTVEYLNYLTGRWESCTSIESATTHDRWNSSRACLKIPLLTKEEFQKSYENLVENLKPEVEILDVAMMVAGVPSFIVKEREPFRINVKIKVNKQVPVLDVGIKIMRSDGVYVFWQSSGMTSENLYDVLGEKNISFIFDENFYGSGDYLISIHCTNGWDFPENYPYSHVYARKINGYKFSVMRELPEVDFGVLNIRVPVEYTESDFNIDGVNK